MLILDPSLSDDDRTSLLSRIKEIIESNSWKIEKEDIWGDKKMAYKINKVDRAFYVLYNLELDWTKIFDITKMFNLEQNIWRHMFVRQD
jgi:small subunit ribosomal protein S6